MSEGYFASLDIGKSYIDNESWDVLARGIYRVMDSLYEDGVLNKKCVDVRVSITENENLPEKERFDIRLEFED